MNMNNFIFMGTINYHNIQPSTLSLKAYKAATDIIWNSIVVSKI